MQLDRCHFCALLFCVDYFGVGASEISRHDLLATPVKLSSMPAMPRAPAPAFGSHTVEVLQELGLDEGQVESLMDLGVVAVSKGLRKARK